MTKQTTIFSVRIEKKRVHMTKLEPDKRKDMQPQSKQFIEWDV